MKTPRTSYLTGFIALTSVTAAAHPTPQAADTVETWEVGATDVDFFLGYAGVGNPRRDL